MRPGDPMTRWLISLTGLLLLQIPSLAHAATIDTLLQTLQPEQRRSSMLQ